ncbi:protein kinase domain-containing protein [Modestobacter marinus]|uniref:protein kinase domain-containing protein n=1 Tax=Modestobacter marinus TaxID=477641 RepID=UPI0021BBBDE9|nr:protein kinase [Modestobacter marinus]
MQPQDGAIGGRYELSSLIATGGMGQVWRARDRVLNRDVAVKVLRTEFTGDATFLARFRAEAQHSAGLIHPHIATLFDYGEVPAEQSSSGDHLAYLVMELVRGESLSSLLRREQRLRPERTLQIVRQTADGLAAAHAAGVVHRDVKPGNVLLTEDGSVKITDFGVASSAASVPLTLTGQVVGTAHYLSPEQAKGGKAGPASDVYALGLVAYECLAGRRAFEGESSVQVALMHIQEVPPPLPPDVPVDVRALVGHATAKDPAVRIPDGAALRDAVDALLSREPGPARRAAVAVPPVAVPTAVAPPPASGPGTSPMPTTRVLPLPESDASPLDQVAPADGEQPAGRRWRRLLVSALAVLLVAGIVFGGFQLLGNSSDTATPQPTAAPPAPTTTAAPTVQLVSLTAADFVGRPLADVQAGLTALGFAVTPKPLQTSDVPDGEVIAVDPTGPLPRGTAVTVTYAVTPPPPPTPTPAPETTDENSDDGGDDGNGDEGGGNGDEGNPGNGNGNGNDDDGGNNDGGDNDGDNDGDGRRRGNG